MKTYITKIIKIILKYLTTHETKVCELWYGYYFNNH